jgi:hypothetical protein
MMASRGMGAIRASKMPKPVTKPRRDDTDFTMFAKGGMSRVKAAGPFIKGDKYMKFSEKGEPIGMEPIKKMKSGGESRVNEAGNYTKPGMRKSLFNSIKAGGKGGAPGQWSARKSQLLAMKYKARGGGYRD